MIPRLPVMPRTAPDIEVRTSRPADGAELRPPLCVIGTAPAARGPVATLVRTSRADDTGWWIEQHRFGTAASAAWLPSLRERSRLRDSVELLLSSGVRQVEALLLRVDGPADALLEDGGRALLDGALDRLGGALLIAPDIASRPQRGPVSDDDVEVAWVRVAKLTRALARGLRDRYQTLLLDAPGGPPALTRRAVQHLQGADLMLCGFVGSDEDLAAHGWRCASAVVAGAAVGVSPLIHHGPTGLRVAMGPGRRRPATARFGAPLPAPAPLADGVVAVALDGDVAEVRGEMTLRSPQGHWPLAALRTAKVVHERIVEAAQSVVFRPVNAAQAFLLNTLIDKAIRPFVSAGVLIGPAGDGVPALDAVPVRDPGAPGFIATITAQLRPWCTQVRVQVDVREGARPRVEFGP